MEPMSVLPFQRGEPVGRPDRRDISRLRVYDCDSLFHEGAPVAEHTRERFEHAARDLRMSSRWASARVEAGYTGGYRFVYLVLRERDASPRDEPIVASVTFAPADQSSGELVHLEADVSREESGELLFELKPVDVPVGGASAEGFRLADELVSWLLTVPRGK
jgi:hypothetical protein